MVHQIDNNNNQLLLDNLLQEEDQVQILQQCHLQEEDQVQILQQHHLQEEDQVQILQQRHLQEEDRVQILQQRHLQDVQVSLKLIFCSEFFLISSLQMKINNKVQEVHKQQQQEAIQDLKPQQHQEVVQVKLQRQQEVVQEVKLQPEHLKTYQSLAQSLMEIATQLHRQSLLHHQFISLPMTCLASLQVVQVNHGTQFHQPQDAPIHDALNSQTLAIPFIYHTKPTAESSTNVIMELLLSTAVLRVNTGMHSEIIAISLAALVVNLQALFLDLSHFHNLFPSHCLHKTTGTTTSHASTLIQATNILS
jgi:hypothetical protein